MAKTKAAKVKAAKVKAEKAAAKKVAAEKVTAEKAAAAKAKAAKAEAAKKAKAPIIAKLESLNIGYDDKMEVAELQTLLDEFHAKQEKPVEVPARAGVAPEVPLGVTTINDHEQRLFAIEQLLKE